jgi:hypothetical protein
VRVDMASQARWKSLLLAGPSCPHPGRRLEAGRGGHILRQGPSHHFLVKPIRRVGTTGGRMSSRMASKTTLN